jgi:hypothetical protein
MAMQLLVRDHHPVIAAAVEGDVDREADRAEGGVAARQTDGSFTRTSSSRRLFPSMSSMRNPASR